MEQLPVSTVNVTLSEVNPLQMMRTYVLTYIKKSLRDRITRGAALTPPLPSLPNCTALKIVWGPVCVTVPVQIVSARYCMGHPAAAPSPWTPGLQPMAAPLCFELPEWNQTIVIDRKAEETPHLTSTHAESNYTPSASALAPAWGFQRARGRWGGEGGGGGGEGMRVGKGGGGGGVILAGEREKYAPHTPPPKNLNATLLNFYWSFKSHSEFCVAVTCVPVVSTGNTGDSAGFSCVVLENNSTRLLSGLEQKLTITDCVFWDTKAPPLHTHTHTQKQQTTRITCGLQGKHCTCEKYPEIYQM